MLNTYVESHHFSPAENWWVDRLLDQVHVLAPHLSLIGWGFFVSAALFAAEGIGLFLRKHWAEYLVVIGSGSLLPIEIWELWHKLAWWKFGVVVGNLLIVVFLVHRLLLDARLRAQQQSGNGNPPSPSSSVRRKPVVHEAP
jgi:uncharacterized membrane protein (DUF2068 family)